LLSQSLADEPKLFDLDNAVNKAIKNVYEGKLKAGGIDADLFKENVSALWDGFQKGYGKASFNTESYPTVNKMQRNVYTFTAFKNHHNVTDMVKLLKDEKGELKPFSQYKKDATKLNANYNKHWLRAEYNTAKASARMAKKWNDAQKNRDLYPYLRYKTVGDGVTRDEHAALNGIVRHIDDPFWNTYLPPNGWNCRCTIVPVRGGLTPVPEDLPQPTDAWKGNSGKHGDVFSRNHPYFKEVSKADREKIINSMIDLAPFERVYTKQDGYVSVNVFHAKSELTQNLEIAKFLADSGMKVRLLPTRFKPGVKNPDAIIDGKTFDFKESIGTATSVDAQLRAGARQANRVLIFLTKKVDLEKLKPIIMRRMERTGLKEVWVSMGKKLYKYDRPD
jgi:SPP1 gp7 family putative phage head morphogenesis protein